MELHFEVLRVVLVPSCDLRLSKVLELGDFDPELFVVGIHAVSRPIVLTFVVLEAQGLVLVNVEWLLS